MPYHDVAKHVTVTKTNMIDEMACGYGIIWRAVVRIWHQVSRRAVQRSQLLQNFTILQVNSCSILNAPPSLQVPWEAPENDLPESESTLLSSRGAWEHLEVLRSTGEVNQSVWEVCVWLPDRLTFCWCTMQIIFYTWWASMNVGSKRPIAWNASRHASSCWFYSHCGIEE